MMGKKIFYLVCMPIMLLTSCNVHEWPDDPEYVSLHLKLVYDTEMTEWNHLYDGTNVTEEGLGETYDYQLESGVIRYVIRAYPSLNPDLADGTYQEFVYTKDITEGYDNEVDLALAPGDYKIMVWSDLVEKSGDAWFYDAENFAEITLAGDHQGSTDYRDAFRGSNTISLESSVMETPPDTLKIDMQRPLAKIEFVSTDLTEFISNEQSKARSESESRSAEDGEQTLEIDINDYSVAFYYVGYMPDTYSMSTDKPVDSSMGVLFMSELSSLSDSEASLGFDYVFVNGTESSVSLQIGIYNNEGTLLTVSSTIWVPVKRNYHTIMRGKFLTTQASSGVGINPNYDGDYNLYIE